MSKHRAFWTTHHSENFSDITAAVLSFAILMQQQGLAQRQRQAHTAAQHQSSCSILPL
jgi:hypothetical protein